MRNIATCYSEHAVRVSDSYCSGPLNRSSPPSFLSPKSPVPSVQNAVVRTYKVRLPDQEQPLFITITWCSKLICQGFFIKVGPRPGPNNHCQLDRPRGSSLLEGDRIPGPGLEVRWDLCRARFEAGPEPVSGFHVAVSAGPRVVLSLGDGPGPEGAQRLVGQYERFSGRWGGQASTRARFGGPGGEHEVTVRCGPEEDGPRSPVLSVFVDGKRVIRVKRLQWNFRGNQVIFVDGLLVDVMWDVFGWFFDQAVNVNGKNGNNGKNRLFMFRTRSGLDSRLWLEEEERKLAGKNHDKPEFSLLLCVSSKNPG